jgi:hypothetical protein
MKMDWSPRSRTSNPRHWRDRTLWNPRTISITVMAEKE